MSNISLEMSRYYDFHRDSNLRKGKNSFKIHRALVHPPRERKVRTFKSIYSAHSDDTSCYGSDSCAYQSTDDESDEMMSNPYLTHKTSYKATLNKWKLMEQNKMKQDIELEKRSNGISQAECTNGISLASEENHQNRSPVAIGRTTAGKVNPYKDTDLNAFLADIDEIEDCDLSRRVGSEDGKLRNSSDIRSTNVLVQPGTKRWLILTLVCISIGVRSYVSVVFGQINDIFSNYFSVDATAVDWLTNASSVTTLFTIIGFISVGGRLIRLRPLCLAMTGSALVGTALLTAAAGDRKNGYALAVIGQIVIGFNNAITVTITPMVAATWFPDGQVASALSSTFVSVGVGEALGSYLPGVALFVNEIAHLRPPESSGQGEDNMSTAENEELLEYKLVLQFAIPTGICVIIFLLSVLFFNERPFYPPSEAQAFIRERLDYEEQLRNLEDSSIFSTSRSSIASANEVTPCESFRLLTCKSFTLATFVYGVAAASASTSITLLSSILSETNLLGQHESADSLSGKIMGVMWICFAIGPFIAGVILDRTGKYRETAIVSISGLMIGTVGIPISLCLGNVACLYSSHALTGLFMGAAETTFFEIAAETTYPSPELSFASILNVSWITFFIIYPVVGRITFDAFPSNASAAYLCPTIFNFVSAMITIFGIHPTYRRRDGNFNEDLDVNNERTALLG